MIVQDFVSIILVPVMRRLVNDCLTACIGMIGWDILVMMAIGNAILKSENCSGIVFCHLLLVPSTVRLCSTYSEDGGLKLSEGSNP